jgi:serine/threonine protein kinase
MKGEIMSAEPTMLKKHGWKVLGSVGGGAAAAVFKVQKPDDNTVYAAKVLRNTGGRPEPRQRFVQEIDALKKLDHPAIVKVHGCQCDDQEDVFFYIMDYVDGLKPLNHFVGSAKKEPNPFCKDADLSLVAYLMLLEALQACEKVGIVHRDLSLANVLVRLQPLTLKLIDFGCCHMIDGQAITLTDKDVGTPGYRAPECESFSGAEPTTKADVYSAGKILWSMVTDQGAFQREEPVFRNLALSLQLPDTPMTWHLHHIFQKTIRHKPDDRYKSATAAIEHGRFVLGLVRGGYPPLEKLKSALKCPVCGVSELTPLGYLASNTLLDHETAKMGVTDSEVVNQIQRMQEVAPHLGVCRYCGFACNWFLLVMERNLKYRETLR